MSTNEKGTEEVPNKVPPNPEHQNGQGDHEDEEDDEQEDEGPDKAPNWERRAERRGRALAVTKKELKDAQAEIARLKGDNADPKKPADTPKGPSNGDLALLVAMGYKDKDEQQLVINAAKKYQMELSDAANDEFVLAQVSKLRKQKSIDDATPKGRGRSSSPDQTVEYWIEKGGLPPDRELRSKVLAARRTAASKSKPKFAN